MKHFAANPRGFLKSLFILKVGVFQMLISKSGNIWFSWDRIGLKKTVVRKSNEQLKLWEKCSGVKAQYLPLLCSVIWDYNSIRNTQEKQTYFNFTLSTVLEKNALKVQILSTFDPLLHVMSDVLGHRGFTILYIYYWDVMI